MATVTRSGRIIKKPDRYVPTEKVTDDFSDSDLESDWESDISSEVSYDPEDIEADGSPSDVDDFVVEDDEDSEEEVPTEDESEA